MNEYKKGKSKLGKNHRLIQSLSRAFAIIDCFDETNKELTLNDISEKVNLNINTTRGLVQTLLYHNYLSFDKEDRKYRLGSIFIDKAEIAQYDYTEKIIDLIRGNLQKIADEYSVSTRFHAVENVNITTLIERSPSHSRYILTIHLQTDFPLYASASGKLILAHLSESHRDNILSNTRWEKYGSDTILDRETLEKQLEEVVEKDVSLEQNELGNGYSSIAIPVFKDGNLVYTISAVSTTQLINDSYEELLAELRKVRERIYNLSVF